MIKVESYAVHKVHIENYLKKKARQRSLGIRNIQNDLFYLSCGAVREVKFMESC